MRSMGGSAGAIAGGAHSARIPMPVTGAPLGARSDQGSEHRKFPASSMLPVPV